MKAQKGFTLIELMIVVAIIGILASVSIPMYRNYTIKTRTGTTISQVSNIQTALTVTENEGALVTDLDATFGTDTGWQNIGLKGSPIATKDYSSINIVDGVITMTLTGSIDKACNGKTIVFTPTFGVNATTWGITHTCAGDANVVAVIDNYINRNVGS